MWQKVFLGTSGWSYSHWKENFYLNGLKENEWLSYYSSHFKTVEVNTTFYHIPKKTTVQKWFQTVPKDFTFSIKASRYITHQKRLVDCKNSLKILYDSIKPLKNKIGPILFQLPPSFKLNLLRLKEFVALLNPKYKYVFEFRDDSWFTKEVYALLTENKIALCISDLHGKLTPCEITSSFTYIRLHGPQNSYRGFYGKTKLKGWKRQFESWEKISIYCYFDNDEKGYAIRDLKTMINLF